MLFNLYLYLVEFRGMVSEAKGKTSKFYNETFTGDKVKYLNKNISSSDRILGLKSLFLSNLMGNLGFFIKQTLKYRDISSFQNTFKTTMDRVFTMANDIADLTSKGIEVDKRNEILSQYLPLCLTLTHLNGYFDLVAENYSIEELKDLRQFFLNVFDDFVANAKTEFQLIEEQDIKLFENEFVDFLDNFISTFNNLVDKVFFATRLKKQEQSVNNSDPDSIKQEVKNETVERVASLLDRFQLCISGVKLAKQKEKLTEESIIEALKLYFGKRSNPKSDFFKGDFSNMGIFRMGTFQIPLTMLQRFIDDEFKDVISLNSDDGKDISKAALLYHYLAPQRSLKKSLEEFKEKYKSISYEVYTNKINDEEMVLKPLAEKILNYFLSTFK